jgi:predicted RNase H-like nuclease (RuvC/YqgF family)
MNGAIERAVQSYKSYLIHKLQEDCGYYEMQHYDVKIRTTLQENADAHIRYIKELIDLVIEHKIPDGEDAKKWKKKHDELGRKWQEYTQEWQYTIESLENENLDLKQQIRELENYKWMYEQLSK